MNCKVDRNRSALRPRMSDSFKLLGGAYIRVEISHVIFHTPSAGHSVESTSNASQNLFTMPLAVTSSVKGTTATIRGAPSTPLNMRVASTSAYRFASWICFAWFRLFDFVCAALEFTLGTFWGAVRVGMRPFAFSFREDFVACRDLKGLFC